MVAVEDAGFDGGGFVIGALLTSTDQLLQFFRNDTIVSFSTFYLQYADEEPYFASSSRISEAVPV